MTPDDNGGERTETPVTERGVDEDARLRVMEKAIATLRHRYHFLAASLPHIMWSSLADGWPDYYNQRWWDYTGLLPGQVPDDEWAWPHVLHPDDISWSRHIWSEAIKARQTFQFECRLKRASDGEYRWHRVIGVPLCDEQGQVDIWVGTATDIEDYRRARDELQAAHDAMEEQVEIRTAELLVANEALEREIEDRLRVEAALRESQELFQSAFEHAAIGIVLSRPDGRWYRVNRAFYTMLGHDEDSLLQLTEMQITHPDDRFLGLNDLADVLAGLRESYRVEKRYLSRAGEVVWALVSTSAVRDERGAVLYLVSQIQDMTDRKRAEEALATLLSEQTATLEVAEHRALHDALTDLPNRALLRDRVEQAIREADTHRSQLAFLLLDLDRFKLVNHTYGHHAGDSLLREVSARLRSAMRQVDTVARLGGDEFAILLPEADAEAAQGAMRRIIATFQSPFSLNGISLSVGGSIGAAVYPLHGDRFDLLMQRADVAMYHAKRTQSGGAIYQDYQDAPLT